MMNDIKIWVNKVVDSPKADEYDEAGIINIDIKYKGNLSSNIRDSSCFSLFIIISVFRLFNNKRPEKTQKIEPATFRDNSFISLFKYNYNSSSFSNLTIRRGTTFLVLKLTSNPSLSPVMFK